MTWPTSGKPAGWKRSRPAATPIWAWMIRHTGPSGSSSLCSVERSETGTAVAIGGHSLRQFHFSGYEPAAKAPSNVVVPDRDEESRRQSRRKVVVERTIARHVHHGTARSLV